MLIEILRVSQIIFLLERVSGTVTTSLLFAMTPHFLLSSLSIYIYFTRPRVHCLIFHFPLLSFLLFHIYFTRPREHCLIFLTHRLTHLCLSPFFSTYAPCTI